MVVVPRDIVRSGNEYLNRIMERGDQLLSEMILLLLGRALFHECGLNPQHGGGQGKSFKELAGTLTGTSVRRSVRLLMQLSNETQSTADAQYEPDFGKDLVSLRENARCCFRSARSKLPRKPESGRTLRLQSETNSRANLADEELPCRIAPGSNDRVKCVIMVEVLGDAGLWEPCMPPADKNKQSELRGNLDI